MKLISFSFSKIDVEKMSDNLKDVKLNTGIDILDIKEIKSNMFKTKEDWIVVSFTYNIKYEKDIANLFFKGNLVVSLEPKEAKEVLKQWKNKKIPDNFKLTIFNIILKKSSIKAMQFEEDFNLPLHVPLPSIRPPENKEDLKK